MRTRSSAPSLAVLAAFALSACAGFSADGGFAGVESAAKERLGKDLKWAKTDADRDALEKRVTELLAKPLSVDDAVQIALLNNKGLQASFAELGITEAELVQAGRLPNPGFSFGRNTRGNEVEIERGIHFNLARLLAMPLVSEVEGRRFARVQSETTQQMLSLASQTRKAWIAAVAAG